jgi:hypothetical protein
MNIEHNPMDLPTRSAPVPLDLISKPDLHFLVEASIDQKFEILDVDLRRSALIIAVSLR